MTKHTNPTLMSEQQSTTKLPKQHALVRLQLGKGETISQALPPIDLLNYKQVICLVRLQTDYLIASIAS